MSKTLFEEAITDARQLREAAEENAKKAIVEAVTPRIRDFIEQHLVGGSGSGTGDFLSEAFDGLKEEEEEENDAPLDLNEDAEEEVELDAAALQELAAMFSKKPNPEVEANAALNALSDSERSKLLGIVSEDKESNVSKSASYYEVDLDELRNNVKSALHTSKKGMNESVSDDDIFEISDSDLRRMLEEDIKITGLPADVEKRLKDEDIQLSAFIETEEEEGEGEEAELGEPEAEEPADEPEGEVPPLAAEPAEKTDEVYELDENILRRELMRLRGINEGRKTKKSVEAEKSRKKSIQKAADAFGGGAVTEMDEIEMNKLAMESRHNRALENKLNEYRSAMQTLRGQLNEMNLFNCKLLYVNKILQNKEVTSSQRRTIIEALDGAKSIREAKLLYESLSASLTKENTSSLNESIGRLSPGSSSRATGTASPRGVDMPDVDRWARLAGINK
jgi:hypothetical protein